MSNILRVGVIGVGYLGRFHALIYSKMLQVKLIGIFDRNLERAHEVATEIGCKAFATAEELLGRGVDAVSIVVPTSAHLEVARPFLEHGIHTLLEKPIA
ncbi:oxidoreductase, partial [Achromatium sp. WMS1]